jgi:hypothetical protein
MSRLTGYFGARKPAEDSEPPREPAADSGEEIGREDPAREDPAREDLGRDDVFGLIPPQPAANTNAAEDSATESAFDAEPAAASGRNVHTIGITDLSRLSIDNDGRLYWDGKPVEVRRRIMMSRPQIVGATFVAVFVVIGAIGAAVHGSAAALDWACRLGWATTYCPLPEPAPAPPQAPDIPA